MSLDLVFSRPRYTPGDPLDLVFGATSTAPILPLEITGTITFGAPLISGIAVYDNRLPNSVSTLSRARHQVAAPAEVQVRAPWAPPVPIDRTAPSAWQAATPDAAAPTVPWDLTQPVERADAARWQAGTTQHARAGLVYQVCNGLEVLAALAWKAATQRSVGLHAPHQVSHAMQVAPVVRLQQGTRVSVVVLAPHQVGTPAARTLRARWQAARPIPPGITVYVPPGTGGPDPREISLDLVFACPPYAAGEAVDLVFGHVCAPPTAPGAPLFILPARYYMAVHSLTCHKLPSMEPVPIFGVNLSAAEGSFGWSFTAEAPPSVFDQLAATGTTPTRVLITLDGLQFEFVLDEPEKSEAFGGNGTSISGRSATALLSGRYALETARHNTAAATAQQLALAALEFTGFTLDWGLPDWLVPAGAWSHIGTPLAAVQSLVASAGGHLQSHRNAATLQARHPYPDLTGGILGVPWNWGDPGVVPDIELAPDAVMLVGTSRVFGADINGVYVSGTTHPPRALYKRQGTAGDKLASLITDPLIVAPEVARMRGRSVVGAAGLKQFVTLELPVLTGVSQPGVIDPGKLLQVNNTVPWRGRVRSVSVSAPFGGKVRQQLRVEQHLEVTP